ncbi:glycoside hydrolase family 16 protein [Patellaria atrata CBS 101060]|uniref:Glycoside hydrolase family 16 protein n=1 Tax=Patellaria atrata CBS 101060 TaxID=1346257 RepID=A0A9P4SE66_9PEZI|nr:glycoside hydrolase family 16 protein [Patellaria atrata CBS 101060]
MFHSSQTTTADITPVRPGTPESDTVPRTNPFATPYASVPGSRFESRNASSTGLQLQEQRYFHSRRVKKGTVEKPWTKKKDPREKWVTIIPLVGLFIGLAVSGFLIWDGLKTVVNHTYCPVLEEDFSTGIDDRIWTKEVELGGYGNGQFEMTTSDEENIFVKDGNLIIKPTLQDESLINQDKFVINLMDDGICSSEKWYNCITGNNATNGTIINPVKSARLSTRSSRSIKYGRIEVEAKLPTGDWLWPAIWMLPRDAVYGSWPKSGEIDIMESRGNNWTYSQGGNNIVSSTLHWGPNAANDAWWRNNVKRKALHTTYSSGFHTFGLEWSEKYIFTYIDTRLLQVMYTHFSKPLWESGNFPLSDSNGTRLTDPWSQSGRPATPFDEDFYLIINVAVGSTNGWFKDGASGKPWVDTSPTARKDFWEARNQWYPTWEKNGQMEIRSVKMWQQKGYNGC